MLSKDRVWEMAIDDFLSGMMLHEDVSPIDKWWCPIVIFVLGGVYSVLRLKSYNIKQIQIFLFPYLNKSSVYKAMCS